MRRIGTFLVVLGLLLGSSTALQAGKGGEKGKPGGGGGGGDPAPDPAIVFPRGDDLVVMNADGSNQELILRGAEALLHPSWSPDGTQIAFASQVWGDGIYVIDRDGSNLRKVVGVFAASNPGPVWSPVAAADGSYKIAYVDSVQSSGTADEVFLVNLDGSGRQQLTTTPGRYYIDLTWSPDAATLAVTATDLDEYDVVLFDLGLVDGTGEAGSLKSMIQMRQGPLRRAFSSSGRHAAASNPRVRRVGRLRSSYSDSLTD